MTSAKKTYRSYAQERRELNSEIDGLGRKPSASALSALQFRSLMMNQLELHSAHIDDLQERMANGPGIPKGPWSDFGHFLQAVKNAASPGGFTDPNLNTRAASGLNSSAPSDGGFLIPQQYSDALMTRSLYTSRLAPMCTTIPITKGSRISLTMPDETSRADGARFGGVFSYYKNEAEQGIATRPKIRNVDLELQKILAFCYCTDELLSDAPALGMYVTKAFTDETSFRIDQAIFSGSGTGQPLGFLNSTALYTVAEENGQAAASIVPANIYNMYSHLLLHSRPNSAWIISDSVENALLSEPLTSGMYEAAEDGQEYGHLLGLPVIPLEQAAPLGSFGDLCLVDLSDYLLAINDMRTALSLEVRYLYDETLFRFSWRVDGQPSLRAPITPYRGTTQKSAYVALAPR